MTDVPAKVARAIVLRHLPRALRAALDPEAATGQLAEQLVADADAVAPGLGATTAAWVRENVGESAGLGRWIETSAVGDGPPPASGEPSGGLAALHLAAAAHDDPTLREIAEALVLLGGYDRVAALAPRAASAAWSYHDRLAEVGAALHGLALASSGVRERHRAERPPWALLDAHGNPASPSEGEPCGTPEAWRAAIDHAFDGVRRDVSLLVIGLSAIASGRAPRAWTLDTLAGTAMEVGRACVDPLTFAAAHDARAELEARHRSEIQAMDARLQKAEAEGAPVPPPEPEVAAGHVLVCAALEPKGSGKSKDIARGYEHAIGKALPLAVTPDLAAVRSALLAEFPYAPEAVDAVLGAFAGRVYVHAPPMIVAGRPGAGKTRFVRRLGEALGVGVFRVDGSNDAGGSFGGTERRWYSSEPCRPFMAIARHRQANPIVLVDEVDKAATRSDYGRLWDSMLQALDPENARRFPDPSLQTDLDISFVTVICTANEPSALPGPLLDRLRVVRFPEPRAEHLDALLPGVLAGLAEEAGLDARFHAPIDGVERAALRARWRGGSVRRLRRAVEAVLRVRERVSSAHKQ